MQSRTITSDLLSKSIITKKFLVCAFFLMSMMALQQQANAQGILIEIDDLVMFSGPSSNTHAWGGITTNQIDLQISPNPATNHIRIQKAADVELKRLDILDMHGNLLYSNVFSSSTPQLVPLDSGLYNFRIYTNKGLANKVVSII